MFQITTTVKSAMRVDPRLYNRTELVRRVREINAGGADRISIEDTRTGKIFDGRELINV
ncbi:hypothetical protein IWY39_002582 [Sphingobium sp. JAI105]|nr:hypothetical protein [Sphingobium sp. JAI105]